MGAERKQSLRRDVCVGIRSGVDGGADRVVLAMRFRVWNTSVRIGEGKGFGLVCGVVEECGMSGDDGEVGIREGGGSKA